MKNDPLYNQWRELGWRRKLSAEEEARVSEWLREHPETQSDWESESALNELLASLPSVPVASNFTSRVVQAAQRETYDKRPGERLDQPLAWWRRWVPRAAFVAVILAGLISYNHIQSVERAERAESLAAFSQVAPLPSTEVLSDFDAIAALSSTPPADEELLKIMQ